MFTTINNTREQIIDTKYTVKWHFAKCNHSKCNAIFLVNPEESPGELGFICPECSKKTTTSHIVQCSSCKTILNFVRANPNEEKVVFNVPKCSHCVGTVEDEWEIESMAMRSGGRYAGIATSQSLESVLFGELIRVRGIA